MLDKIADYFCKEASRSKRLAYLKKQFPKAKIPFRDSEKIYFSYVALALGQKRVISLLKKEKNLDILKEIERFFSSKGGVIGYQKEVIEILNTHKKISSSYKISQPPCIDLRKHKQSHSDAFRKGVEHLDRYLQVYPIGGAADRLGCVDPKTKQPLPAALLPFFGKTLLERLIEDVIAKQYLYYKLFKKKIEIPIVIMTSKEKRNHDLIAQLLKKMRVPSRQVLFVQQPGVVMVDRKGKWQTDKDQILTKPGGHGMIWNLLQQSKAVQNRINAGKKYALIRQINNPLASSEGNEIFLLGEGIKGKKTFGFFTCQRKVKASEGMVVLKKSGSKKVLTNIEYTDLAAYGIDDLPEKKGSSFSKYPANLNLLFCDLTKISPYVKKDPFPGALLNFKDKKSARLELTMQNIADSIEYTDKKEPVFCVFQDRSKSLSPIKKKYVGESVFETPVGAWQDFFLHRQALLYQQGARVPKPKKTPEIIFDFHPTLYPVFNTRLCRALGMKKYSCLYIGMPSVVFDSVVIDGALQIRKSGNLSSPDQLGQGKVLMKNVEIKTPKPAFDTVFRVDSSFKDIKGVDVLVEGDGHLLIEDVVFTKPIRILVKANTYLHMYQSNGEIIKEEKRLSQDFWEHRYI